MRVTLAFLLLTTAAQAQWQVQQSGTTADLRGIHALGNGVAWASGSKGTVLRTTDNGSTWETCAMPLRAEALDFRGVQGFDAKRAIVMSSGKGDLSRLYKTVDGCKSWEMIFLNPDRDGFWDGIFAETPASAILVIGDPIERHFPVYASTSNSGKDWYPFQRPERAPDLKLPMASSSSESLYAASNSILRGDPYSYIAFVTGGKDGSFLYATHWHSWVFDYNFATYAVTPIPMEKGATAGAFSFTSSQGCDSRKRGACAFVVVGGDYAHPEKTAGTAAFAVIPVQGAVPDKFRSATTPPHGYRSAVAYSATSKAWITVGPNGTDVSTDGGRSWHPLHPGSQGAPDEDQHWNALSLPFVVGPHGRIGLLRADALKP